MFVIVANCIWVSLLSFRKVFIFSAKVIVFPLFRFYHCL
nr:MAG TPA: hypothetical protein [Caudoviricetes sp.]